MLRPAVILDILQNFTLFATDKKHRKTKVICRYQQYHAANQIVERVVSGVRQEGPNLAFSRLGQITADGLCRPETAHASLLKNPTVLIVVDRIDLDTQITATFNAADVPNLVSTDSREELQTLLAQDVRKVIITTIHKFGEAGWGAQSAREHHRPGG